MPHGIWKGTLGFGLVSIGIELFAAEAPDSFSLDLLDRRDHAPVGYRKYNKSTGAEIDGDDIVKGYAVSKGNYVILSDEDLKSANVRATQTIDVIGFVKAGSIPPMYFDKPYVVTPLKGSEKAYALLVRTLEDTEQIGIAQIVLRTAQHVAAVYASEQAIVVQLLRYEHDVRHPATLGVLSDNDARRAIRPTELTMAHQLVKSMQTTWDPSAFRDTYRDDIMRLIEERAAGAVPVSVATEPNAPTRVLDLMAALTRSLAEHKAPTGAKKGAKTSKAGKDAKSARTTKSATHKKSTKPVTPTKLRKLAKAAVR